MRYQFLGSVRRRVHQSTPLSALVRDERSESGLRSRAVKRENKTLPCAAGQRAAQRSAKQNTDLVHLVLFSLFI
jgi:hypothetical protein